MSADAALKDVEMPEASSSVKKEVKPETKADKGVSAVFDESLPKLEGKSEGEVQALLAGAAKQSRSLGSDSLCRMLIYQSAFTSQTPTSPSTATSSLSHAATTPCTAGFRSRP